MNGKTSKKRFILLKKSLFIISFIIILAGSFTGTTGRVSASEKVTSTVTSTLKNGVFTVKGKGKMPDSAKPKFAQRKKIKKIVIKKGVTSLPEFAFKNCKKATSIIIASSVREIGMHAFANTMVKKLTIPKTVKRIGWGICFGCASLKTLEIPGTFDIIEPSTDHWLEPFVSGKNSLKTVKFSTALDLELVRMAGDCENFKVSPSDPEFKSIDGIIYTKDGKTLARVPYGRSEAVIAEGCETIATGSYTYLANGHHEPYIYSGCGALKNIVFPSSVKKVTDKVYSDNTMSWENTEETSIKLNMEYLDVKSIKILWKYCNWKKPLADELVRIGCAVVTDGMVILNNGYLCGYIGDKEETVVIIPDNVKTIGERAFSDYSLSSVILGKNVELIKTYAFCSDRQIKVYIKSPNIKISDYAFYNCETYEIIFDGL